MKFNVKKIISGTLASIMIAQSLIYGDGTCKGLLHNDTIQTFAAENYSVSSQADYENNLLISGYIDLEDNRSREITVLIFDDCWNTIASTTVYPNEYFSVSANNINTNTTHIKIECNGYLPRFYKDMGFGSYQLGTAENPEVLFFGDTTYNTGADNQWSDEVINYDDLSFVANQLGKIKGDENYDEYYDFNQDGIIDNNDINIIAEYDGAIYEDGFWYTSDTKESYYNYPEEVTKYDLNGDNIIDVADQQYLCDLYPCTTYKGDEDFEIFEYMDIDSNGIIEEYDYNYFANYINIHNGHNPYNDYIYNLTLTGNSYHNGAMYLENTHLDLANHELTVNGNFVFRTANPYNPMWNNNPECILNINNGSLDIKGQFDFGQANSYDKIIMTNDNGRLYINGIWNYITLADMEGLWTAGTIYFFGSTWQVNEASGDKSIYSTGTHSICFYYSGGQQVIRWANTQDCIYDEATKEYNTLRRFNFDYKDSNGNCLGITFPCGYSAERYYFRAALPEEITKNTNAASIPYKDWDKLDDIDENTIPDIIDDQINNGVYGYIPNDWITDEYGDSAEPFINKEHPTADDNKEALANTLEYTYSNYDEPVAEAIIDYIGRSLEQIVLGNYTNEVTLLGTGGQIVLSIVGLDLPCDLRDLSYDVAKWGDIIFGDGELTWEFAGQSFTDLVALFPLVGCLKYSDEASTLLKNSDELYNKAVTDAATECFENGKPLKTETEIAQTTTKNIEKVTQQTKELLNENGKFLDKTLEEKYQKYILRKEKEGKPPRNRLGWKEACDYFEFNSPIARGNIFNKLARKKYDINELNLISNTDPTKFTRVDSYVIDPKTHKGLKIISRKATDLEDIEFETFDKYLSELSKKYCPGTIIHSKTHPNLNGLKLEGQMCLEIPETNKNFAKIDEYTKYAKDKYNIDIIFLAEDRVWDF